MGRCGCSLYEQENDRNLHHSVIFLLSLSFRLCLPASQTISRVLSSGILHITSGSIRKSVRHKENTLTWGLGALSSWYCSYVRPTYKPVLVYDGAVVQSAQCCWLVEDQSTVNPPAINQNKNREINNNQLDRKLNLSNTSYILYNCECTVL